MVTRRQIGIVVDRDRVGAEASRRLDHDDDVVGLHCGDDDLALGIATAIDEQLAGRRPPVLDDRVGQFAGERGEPGAVVACRHADRVALQLALGQPVRVLPAAFDQRVDQRVTVPGLQPGHVADAVAGIAHRGDQRDCAGRGVETDGVADARVLGRIGREHQGDTLVLRGDVAKPGLTHGKARHACAAFGIRDIRDQALVVDLLEREGNRDDPAVELGHGHLRRDIEWAQACVVTIPIGARAGEAETLQDRHVQCRKVRDVPGVVGTARGDGRGDGAARGKDGRHQRVDGAEKCQHLRLRGA